MVWHRHQCRTWTSPPCLSKTRRDEDAGRCLPHPSIRTCSLEARVQAIALYATSILICQHTTPSVCVESFLPSRKIEWAYTVAGFFPKNTEHKYKTISLFSGALGLDLGLESTCRFEVLACVCDTIRTNQRAGRLSKRLTVFEGDISNIDPAKVLAACGVKPGELDLLVGGPPCQSFSTAGRRQATQDPRGTLLWQFLRFVEHMQPRFFLMENVRGLHHCTSGNAVPIFMRT